MGISNERDLGTECELLSNNLGFEVAMFSSFIVTGDDRVGTEITVFRTGVMTLESDIK